MATTITDDREMAIAISSSAGLELVWSLAAVVAALLGLAGVAAQPLSAVATIAVGFALLGRSGALAARWPRTVPEEIEASGVGTDLLGAVVAILAGVLALAEVAPDVLLPAALVALGGLLVLDAPVERRAVGHIPRTGRWSVATAASIYMAFAGVAAMALTIALLSTVAPAPTLLPTAVLLVATAHLVASGALLARFVPGARA